MSTNAVARMETFPELQVADASAADPSAVEADFAARHARVMAERS